MQNNNQLLFGWMRIHRILILGVLCLSVPAVVQAQKKGSVAVLPFRVYAPEPMDHLKKGLQEMLSVRLAEKGLDLIKRDLINDHPKAFLPQFEMADISVLGKDLGADWIITGSVTQIGRKISLDLKVYDVTAVKPPFSIFMVEDDIDMLATTADKASKSIFNQIAGIVQIDSVQVTGNKRIEVEAILAMVDSKKGDSLDPDQLDKDLRAIYKLGFFTDVSIETQDGPKGMIVIFNVTEKPLYLRMFLTSVQDMV